MSLRRVCVGMVLVLLTFLGAAALCGALAEIEHRQHVKEVSCG